MREAPAIVLIERLLAAGAKVQAYDPAAMDVAQKLFGTGVTFAPKSYEALAGADALAVVTEWNEFREPDFAKMRKLMKTPVVFDGRNIYSRELMRTTWLHLLLHRPLSRRGSGHGRRRLHRQPRRQGAGRGRAPGRRVRRPVGWPPAARCGGATSSSATSATTARCAGRPATTGSLPSLHFAALALGGRLGPRSGAATTAKRRGHAGAAQGDGWRRGCGRLVFSSTAAVFGEPTETPIDGSARHAPHQSVRRNQTGDRARAARTSSGRTASGSIALRYFNAAGADPDGEIGEDHGPETHLIPLAIEAALRRRPAARVRRGLSDTRRHVPARLHPRDGPGAGPRARAARTSRRGGASGGVQPGQRRSRSR